MKKTISLLAAMLLMVSLAACGNDTPPANDDVSPSPVHEEGESLLAPEDGLILYEDETVTMRYLGCVDNAPDDETTSSYSVVFYAKNKTDQELMISAFPVALDGENLTNSGTGIFLPQTSGQIVVSGQEIPSLTPETITVQFSLYEKVEGDTYADLDEISIVNFEIASGSATEAPQVEEPSEPTQEERIEALLSTNWKAVAQESYAAFKEGGGGTIIALGESLDLTWEMVDETSFKCSFTYSGTVYSQTLIITPTEDGYELINSKSGETTYVPYDGDVS